MKTFFRFFLIIAIPILLALTIGFFFMQKTLVAKSHSQLLQNTRQEWQIVKDDFNSVSSKNYLVYKKYSEIYKKSDLRFTLINGSGSVILDSSVDYEAIDKMENHADRPEIKEALTEGSGTSSRYSRTLNDKFFYFAKTLPSGNVLRLAYPLEYLERLQNDLSVQMTFIFVILLITIAVITAFLARKLSLPIQKLNYIADNIEKGKTNIHFPKFIDPQMAKIASLIYKIYHAMLNKQNTIKNEQEKLKLIFKVMDEGIILTDLNNNIIHVNESFLDLFEVDIKIGDNLLSSVNDAELLNFFDDIMKHDTIKRSQLPFRERVFEVYLNTLDGQKLTIFHDITDRIKYELFKAELTGNISHELKTPISMIMNYAETLILNEDLDVGTRKKFLETIYSSTNRLNELINDIVELHKLESLGKEFEVNEPVKLSELKNDLDMLYAGVDSKTINFVFENKEIHMLNEHLQSIITNLVDNAIKYSDGEKINVTVTKVDDNVTVVVDDEGPKIAEADKNRIFERFYTCSKSRNKKLSGTGLGLSIVKHIAGLYSGTVKLKGNDLGGNSFCIIFQEKNRK